MPFFRACDLLSFGGQMEDKAAMHGKTEYQIDYTGGPQYPGPRTRCWADGVGKTGKTRPARVPTPLCFSNNEANRPALPQQGWCGYTPFFARSCKHTPSQGKDPLWPRSLASPIFDCSMAKSN
jgi:hypothetical protein